MDDQVPELEVAAETSEDGADSEALAATPEPDEANDVEPPRPAREVVEALLQAPKPPARTLECPRCYSTALMKVIRGGHSYSCTDCHWGGTLL